MKTKLKFTFGCFLGLLASALCPSAFSQGTAFTYQGRLMDNGVPYTGSAELQPTLWDAASGGGQLAVNAPEQVIVAVTNGLFLLPLNFGANFPGAERWLQLAVRTSVEPFTTLAPRQPLTPTPYAITASNLTGPLPAAQLSGPLPSANLSGTYSGAVTLNNAANSFSGSGAGLTALNASQLTSGTVPDARLGANVARTDQVWLLGGNAGTTPGTHFVGTTGNQPLELRVNATRGLRLEPTTNLDTVNVIGGSARNAVGAGVVGATIGGGGSGSFNGSPQTNRVDANFGTISGGSLNTIQANAQAATLGGGRQNTIQPNAWYATLGGGEGNRIQTNAQYATLGGGSLNTIQTGAVRATIGGGSFNTIQSGAIAATLGGGSFNTIQTNAHYATIPGGARNSATNLAFAAGSRAKANHTGAFVWADSQNADFASLRANQFRVRADGGARFDLNEGQWVDLRWQSSLFTSARIINTSSGAYLSEGGAWVNASDRDRKTHFTPVDPQAVLAKVAALPLSEWSYRNEGARVRHVGPMAQDFHAAFGLNGDDKSIATVDADGVALAAIQGLNQKMESGKQKAETRMEKLEAENAGLRKELSDLKRLVEQRLGLTSAATTGAIAGP